MRELAHDLDFSRKIDLAILFLSCNLFCSKDRSIPVSHDCVHYSIISSTDSLQNRVVVAEWYWLACWGRSWQVYARFAAKFLRVLSIIALVYVLVSRVIWYQNAKPNS